MQDSVVEVLVDRRSSIILKVIHGVLMVLTVVAGLLAFTVFAGPLSFGILLVAIALGVISHYVGQSANVEYEYAYFDRELSVDAIYNKERRKRMKTFDLSKMEIFAPLNSHSLDSYQNREVKTLDFSSRKSGHDSVTYVMYIGGSERVLLEPSERLIQAIYRMAPHKVHQD